MVVDVPHHVYSAQWEWYRKRPIADNYAFRTEQAGINAVTYWGLFSDIGSMTACNGVTYTSLAPNDGMWFNGVNSYVEAPDSDDFSVTTTSSITISAWMRPDTLTFRKTMAVVT